jgi:hypothetical protein
LGEIETAGSAGWRTAIERGVLLRRRRRIYFGGALTLILLCAIGAVTTVSLGRGRATSTTVTRDGTAAPGKTTISPSSVAGRSTASAICATSRLDVTLSQRGGLLGEAVYVFTVRNVSRDACLLRDYAKIDIYGGAGQLITANDSRSATALPGGSVRLHSIKLAPSSEATITAAFDENDGGPIPCPVIGEFRLTVLSNGGFNAVRVTRTSDVFCEPTGGEVIVYPTALKSSRSH